MGLQRQPGVGAELAAVRLAGGRLGDSRLCDALGNGAQDGKARGALLCPVPPCAARHTAEGPLCCWCKQRGPRLPWLHQPVCKCLVAIVPPPVHPPCTQSPHDWERHGSSLCLLQCLAAKHGPVAASLMRSGLAGMALDAASRLSKTADGSNARTLVRSADACKLHEPLLLGVCTWHLWAANSHMPAGKPWHGWRSVRHRSVAPLPASSYRNRALSVARALGFPCRPSAWCAAGSPV